jgi:ABC-type Mn2+/Zn2+ transport system ATPase subunit
MTGSELVRLEGVSCRYGPEPVLDGVDLTLSAREFTGVVGPSGSGKTSLLRTILGTLHPSTGRVVRRERLRVGYVPQVETVDWSFPVTVDECVLMARVGRRLLPWASRAERYDVAQVLSRLGIGDLGRRHIRELSGGQQQRVFMARALLQRPELLLLDEPTSGVDVKLRHEVLHLLDDLNASGVAILLTTHDLNGIAAHLPRLVCLNRGIIGVGPPREVLTEEVLERTYGASMEVLEHGGMVVVVDAYGRDHDPRPRRRAVA